jgi:hypothetical protein
MIEFSNAIEKIKTKMRLALRHREVHIVKGQAFFFPTLWWLWPIKLT